MPSRDERPSASRASQRPSANASQRTRPNQAKDNGDDVWGEIMNMKGKGSGGEGGFNKLNTSFWLSNGEEIDIVLLDEQPFMFWGHTIKCRSKEGKTFYRIEACQKSEQDYCVMCESDNKAIGKSKKIIAFRVLDSRGSWDSETKGLDGVPTPKIFTVSIDLAKQIKLLKDDAGTISDKVLKLSKNGTYTINFKFKKNTDGSLRYVNAPDYDGDLPEVLEVYAPMDDDDLMEFIRQFADASDGGNSGGSNRGSRNGKATGSFGD